MYPAISSTIDAIQQHNTSFPGTPIPDDLLKRLATYNDAATKIQAAYRGYAARNPILKVVPSQANTLIRKESEAEPQLQQRSEAFEEFLHGNSIMRARWSPMVEQFHQNLLAQNWQVAFAEPAKFYDYAVTLYVFGKIEQGDFYNLVDVWQCISSYGSVEFKSLSRDLLSTYRHGIYDRIKNNFNVGIDSIFENIYTRCEDYLTTRVDIITRSLAVVGNGEFYPLATLRDLILSLGTSDKVRMQPYLLDGPSKEKKDVSKDDIEHFWRHYGVRAVSVYAPGMPVKPVHDRPSTCAASVYLHDFVHQNFNNYKDKNVNKFLFELIDYIRKITRYNWSIYLWYIFDFGFSRTKEFDLATLFQYVNQAEDLDNKHIQDEMLLAILFYVQSKPVHAQTPKEFDRDHCRVNCRSWGVLYERIQQYSEREDISLLRKIFEIKHSWLYDNTTDQIVIGKNIPASIHPDQLGQNLGFLKITAAVIKKNPELDPYRNQIQLVSYIGENPPANFQTIDIKEYDFRLMNLESLEFENP